MSELWDDFTIPSERVKWHIDESAESASVVDGVNIIGRAVGPAFLVDGASRNKRFYSKALWEKAIDKTKDTVLEGQMLGTIGHKQALDDEALLKGVVSHRISKLWIDESANTGMCEILIINSPAGRVLNSYLRGGIQLAVSSRAQGEILGKTSNNESIVDPNKFMLEGFDFVRVPGVPTAKPVLVESHEEVTANLSNGDSNMTHEVIENLTRQKVSLEGQVDDLARENLGLKDQLNILTQSVSSIPTLNATVESLTARLSTYEKLGTADSLVKVSESQQSLSKLHEEYNDLGSPAEIRKVFSLFENYTRLGKLADVAKMVEDYREYTRNGSTEQVTEAVQLLERYSTLGSIDEYVAVLELMNKYADLGRVSELSKALDLLESYIALGTVEQISQVMDMTEAYQALGTVEEVTSTASIVESYKALGTVEELESVLAMTEAYQELGSHKELTEVLQITESYVALGNPTDIQKAFAVSMSMVESFEQLKSSIAAGTETIVADPASATDELTPTLEAVNNNSTDTVATPTGDVAERYKVDDKVATPADKVMNERLEANAAAGGAESSSRLDRLLGNYSR